jgi:hypothetical protein
MNAVIDFVSRSSKVRGQIVPRAMTYLGPALLVFALLISALVAATWWLAGGSASTITRASFRWHDFYGVEISQGEMLLCHGHDVPVTELAPDSADFCKTPMPWPLLPYSERFREGWTVNPWKEYRVQIEGGPGPAEFFPPQFLRALAAPPRHRVSICCWYSFARQDLQDGSGSWTMLNVPLWPIFWLAGVLAVVVDLLWIDLYGRHFRANLRIRAGRCGRCGYDLRATPRRCPECGTVPGLMFKAKSANGSEGGASSEAFVAAQMDVQSALRFKCDA